jgi:hypothetical protein
MKPISLNFMTLRRDPLGGPLLAIGDSFTGNYYRFDRDEVRTLARLLRNIERHEMPKWKRRLKTK